MSVYVRVRVCCILFLIYLHCYNREINALIIFFLNASKRLLDSFVL